MFDDIKNFLMDYTVPVSELENMEQNLIDNTAIVLPRDAMRPFAREVNDPQNHMPLEMIEIEQAHGIVTSTLPSMWKEISEPCIYLFMDENGNAYIGQTTDINDRFAGHISFFNSKKTTSSLKTAILSGKKFYFGILHLCSADSLDQAETTFIEAKNCVERGYNSNYGKGERGRSSVPFDQQISRKRTPLTPLHQLLQSPVRDPVNDTPKKYYELKPNLSDNIPGYIKNLRHVTYTIKIVCDGILQGRYFGSCTGRKKNKQGLIKRTFARRLTEWKSAIRGRGAMRNSLVAKAIRKAFLPGSRAKVLISVVHASRTDKNAKANETIKILSKKTLKIHPGGLNENIGEGKMRRITPLSPFSPEKRETNIRRVLFHNSPKIDAAQTDSSFKAKLDCCKTDTENAPNVNLSSALQV